MKKIIVLLAAASLMGCKKELTFPEYYDCEKAYKAAVKSAQDEYASHKINSYNLNIKLTAAQKNYDQCIADGEGNK